MHSDFASLFVDPHSHEPLRLQVTESDGDRIITGEFISSTARYPIVRGIPRFVQAYQDNYARSFAYQWRKWSRLQFESENTGRPMEGHTRKMFNRITGQEGDLRNKLILDIGCGAGRFIEIARMQGAKVIGIDYSLAVEAAADNFQHDSKVCICQADALRLPFAAYSFDGAFSIGVLHHTPDPALGVVEAMRVLTPLGWFALCVYEKSSYYNFITVQLWRRLFAGLWPVFGHYPPLLYSYLTARVLRPVAAIPGLGKLVRLFLPSVYLPDPRWSLLDTFDSVTPSFQSAHETYEVFGWLKAAGMFEIEPTNWGSTAFHGRKPAIVEGLVSTRQSVG